MISKHLKDLNPELFILYSDPQDSIYGETSKYHGVITININHMYQKILFDKIYNISFLFEPMKNVQGFLDVSELSKTVILFIHEIFGHNKFIYEKNAFLTSPKKFFNKANDYIEMVYIHSDKEGNQYYRCLTEEDIKSNKGESGQFLEYSFGTCNFGKIMRILPFCSKIEGLFKKNNLKYWVDDLNFFRKYIDFKFIGTLMEKYKLIKMERHLNDLEKEIEEIRNTIKMQEINVDNIIRKYFESCKLPEKKNISENEIISILNYLSSETQKGLLPMFDYWGYIEEKMSLKCK